MANYYPVLRWKQGEQGALQHLSIDTKNLIAPIIDFPDNCGCTDNRVTSFCQDVETFWGANRPIYVDLGTIDYGAGPHAEHPAFQLLRDAHARNLEIIPIITTDVDFDLQGSIRDALTNNYIRSIALRVFPDEEATAHADAAAALEEININNNCDLLVDLGDVSSGRIQADIRVLQSLLTQFGDNYRETVLLSGAFNPEAFQTDTQGRIPRNDFLLWSQAIQYPALRHLAYGDYATVQATLVEVPYLGAPKVKYTLDQEWYVIKGHRARARDNQRQQISRALVGQAFYRGQNYSFGEQRIYQCANGNWGPGSAANWVTIDVTQHITFVANQVTANRAGI